MKIGIVSNLYPPFVRGGAEVIAAMTAEAFKKNWQHVFVISSRPRTVKVHKQGPPSLSLTKISHDEVNGVDIFRFSPFNIYYYMSDFRFPAFIRLLWHLIDTFNIFAYFTCKKILTSEKPDVVITHNIMGLGFLLPRLLRVLGIRHIHTLHDVQLVTPSGLILKGKENSFEHKFWRIIGYPKLMKKLFASPEIVISPSKYILDFYKSRGFFPNSKLVHLPNPIKNLIKTVKKPSYNLELIYIGQINTAKGVLDLIKNFRKLKQNNVNLHIVGVGQDMARARELAKGDKRIIFHGWLHNRNLVNLLSKADILVVPSLCYENSPTVIYEALSIGMPVLAADIGGVAELIREGKNGWVWPAGNFDILNEKISNLYKKRDKIAALADNCRLSVRDYGLDNYTARVLELLNHEAK